MEYPGSVVLQEVFGTLVLESGSLGFVAAEGGGVRDEMGLLSSSLMSGDSDLHPVGVVATGGEVIEW